jgi:hypothetical protein
MEDADGDNIWEFTALLAAGDTILYKYSSDNWNIQEELDSALSCISIGYDPGAPNGWGYVNRLEVISSEVVLDVVCWEECIGCQGQTSVEGDFFNDILIYPNPSNERIHVKSARDIEGIDVYNALGEIIYSERGLSNKNEHALSISKNGLYYISIHTRERIISKKITIHK